MVRRPAGFCPGDCLGQDDCRCSGDAVPMDAGSCVFLKIFRILHSSAGVSEKTVLLVPGFGFLRKPCETCKICPFP